jgi:hypothetical protein
MSEKSKARDESRYALPVKPAWVGSGLEQVLHVLRGDFG